MDIRVIGLGNVLMADDGFGPYVIEALAAAFELPPEVTMIDAGTPGLDLTPHLLGADVAIVVDTVRSDGPGGTLRQYRRDEILRHPPGPRLGPHDPGLKDTLLTLDFAGSGPRDVVLVGVVPARTEASPRLTDAVRAAVPAAIAAVIRELDRVGAAARPRPSPRRVAPWWERAA
jgi:hydrogenase maturation protease